MRDANHYVLVDILYSVQTFFFFGIWVVQQVSEHLTGIHKLNYAVKHLVVLIQLCCFVEMEKENVWGLEFIKSKQ